MALKAVAPAATDIGSTMRPPENREQPIVDLRVLRVHHFHGASQHLIRRRNPPPKLAGFLCLESGVRCYVQGFGLKAVGTPYGQAVSRRAGGPARSFRRRQHWQAPPPCRRGKRRLGRPVLRQETRVISAPVTTRLASPDQLTSGISKSAPGASTSTLKSMSMVTVSPSSSASVIVPFSAL